MSQSSAFEANSVTTLSLFPVPTSSDILLHCEPSNFQVDIPRTIIDDDFSPSELHFAGDANDRQCRAFYNGESYISLNSSLTGCGTVFLASYGYGHQSHFPISITPLPIFYKIWLYSINLIVLNLDPWYKNWYCRYVWSFREQYRWSISLRMVSHMRHSGWQTD